MFKQLRVRAYLRSGIVSDEYLPLDGILYYHFIRAKFGSQDISKSGESNIREGSGFNLPLKRTGPKEGHAWFYNCSFAQWAGDMIESHAFKVKQGDWLRYPQFQDDIKRTNQSRGKFKAYHIKMYYRTVSHIDWFCIGKPDELMQLLRFCTHIGKNAGDGWGEILKWEVIEWPEDWSVRGPNKKLMRAVPAKNSSFLYGLRPSYWNPRHIFPCKMP